MKTSSSRRNFIGGSLSGFASFAPAHNQQLLAAENSGKAKRCLVLWMNGGPSQMETFDPKPGHMTGGPTKAIETNVDGLRIAENLPEIAKQMDKLSVLRNITSREGEHERANYFLHTGYAFVEAFPRPAMGSVFSQSQQLGALPNYVSVGSRGFGPAFLGADHGPFSIENPEDARRLLRVIESRRSRLQLTRSLSEEFDKSHASEQVEQRLSVLSRIEKLIDTPFSQALNLEAVSDRDRQRYGEGGFANRALLAKRLLEVGVPFVEIQQGGWDTHADNFNATARLCGELDRPWAALMEDLDSSGLLDETLVIWMGEFGRTPVINGNRGRDHFPDVTPVVIGGAGVAHGEVIGQTNENGTAIDGERHSVPDLFATIFTALGIKPSTEFPTNFGSMTKATDDGRPIAALL